MPDGLNAAFDDAIQKYIQKDFTGSTQLCERILASAPDDVDALYLSGLCYARTGSANIGVKLVKQAVSLKPGLENYDIRRDWMIHSGVTSQVSLWEKRFFEYLMFKSVEAFLVSYPKCGRTWLRALLGKYALGRDGKGDPLEVLELTRARADFCTLYITHDDYPQWKPAEKQFTNKGAYTGKKVVFLVRDPRDALVSYYFQYTRRDDRKHANDAGFDGNLSDFVRHDIGGLRSLVAFYNVWAANRGVPAGFLLVTYEDMKKDVRKVLGEIVSFLEWPEREEDFIDEVIAFGSFDNMRKLEESNALDNSRLQVTDSNDPERFKVRKGKVGGYTEYLTDDDIRFIDDYLRDNLDDYFAMYK